MDYRGVAWIYAKSHICCILGGTWLYKRFQRVSIVISDFEYNTDLVSIFLDRDKQYQSQTSNVMWHKLQYGL